MSCEAYYELLSAHLDGELSPQEERTLEEHLAVCGECRALAAQLEQMHTALSGMEQPVPEELTQRVMDRVREETLRQKKTGRRRLVRWAAGLAACLVVCVGAYQLTHMGHSAPDPRMVQQIEEDQSQQSRSVTCEPAVFSVGSSEPDFYGFANEQALRVTYGATPQAPSARILGSVESLEGFAAQFPEDDLEDALGAYDAGFFTKNRLLAIVVEANSGSVSFTIASQGLRREEVELVRAVPETGTDDMAAWLVLAEVDSMFNDGNTLRVVFRDLPNP